MTESKKISELGQNTVRLITATQIATSVPDIIKELVENALDAGSTIIRVKLVPIRFLNFLCLSLHLLKIYFFCTGK